MYSGLAILLAMSMALFLASIYLAYNLNFDTKKINPRDDRKRNISKLKKDVMGKIAMVSLLMVFNLMLTGYIYQITEKISTGLYNLSLVFLIINLTGFIALEIYMIVKLFKMPFDMVVEYVAQKKSYFE